MSSNSTSQGFSTFTSTTYTSTTTPSGTTARHTHTDPSGTTITDARAAAGQEPQFEQRRFETGQPRVLSSGGAGGQGGEKGRIEDVTDQEEGEKEVDRKYREAMEDEYAKREGGA